MTSEEIEEFEELKREFKDDPDLEDILNGFLCDCFENENNERQEVEHDKSGRVE